MKIELHEEAAKHFNEKATTFLYELKPDELASHRASKSPGSHPIPRESSASHTYISGIITENEITEMMSWGYVDQLSGRQAARFFLVDNTPIGLNQGPYLEFEQFVENLHRKREINTFLSQDFLRDCIFEWFEKRYKGLLRQDSSCIEFLIERAEGVIKPLKISIPISFLIIERHFRVGNITFEYFKTDFYDRYITHQRTHAERRDGFNAVQFGAFATKFRKQYQGVVFASITIEGEEKRCVELAKRGVDDALMVLRFFSPTSFVPQIPCYFGMMGHTQIPEDYCFVFEGEFPLVQEHIAEPREHRWAISARHVVELETSGLSVASDLIMKKNRTEFQDLVLSAMSLFTRSVTSEGFQDRIVYALVSIETILLRDQTEPIQSSIGLRLAFLIESSAEARRVVKELINKAYKIRSQYIHHGKRSEDWELLRSLQHVVWTGIHDAMLLTDRLKTQAELLDHIDSIVFS